jgi:hypothetical protein
VEAGQSIATAELLLPWLNSSLCAMAGYGRMLSGACMAGQSRAEGVVELWAARVPEP